MLLALLLAKGIMTKKVGDRPNIELKTGGGAVFWKTLRERRGWRLQINSIDGHARILDENNIRKAWGSASAMKEKFERLGSDTFVKPGDIIGISRKLYDHYGVYIGNDEVIHYAAKGIETSKNAVIHKTDMKDFLGNSKDFFVLHFPPEGGAPQKLRKNSRFLKHRCEKRGITDFLFRLRYKLYSPEQTVQRAISRLGEKKYNLTRNNCEHFALWCKTGISDSRQVETFLSAMAGL